MLTWGAALEIGHCEFDRDHRQLIAMVNLLADALQLGDGPQALVLAGDLEAKADVHRLNEEAEMQAQGVDMIPVIEAHRRVADMASAVRLAIQAGDLALSSRLTVALEESLSRAVAADKRAFTSSLPRANYG